MTDMVRQTVTVENIQDLWEAFDKFKESDFFKIIRIKENDMKIIKINNEYFVSDA